MLTIHVLGAKYVIDSYDIKAVSEIVDYINFAALDYHGPWEKRTAPSTPLTSSDESNVVSFLFMYRLYYIFISNCSIIRLSLK